MHACHVTSYYFHLRLHVKPLTKVSILLLLFINYEPVIIEQLVTLSNETSELCHSHYHCLCYKLIAPSHNLFIIILMSYNTYAKV